MIKNPTFLIVLVVLAVCGCESIGNSPPVRFFKPDSVEAPTSTPSYTKTLPGTDRLVIVGISGRQSRREDEILLAKEDAARKVSIYHSVEGTLEHVQDIGAGFWDYNVGSNVFIEYDQRLEQFMEKLSYDPDKDVMRNENGVVFVRFTYPAVFPGRINYTFGTNSDGSPEWTTRPPGELSGFIAGVGRSSRLERIGDTIRRSYENAVASIVSKISSEVSSRELLASATNSTESQIYSHSTGKLKNFLVLETWINPRTQAVWTLAIAEADN